MKHRSRRLTAFFAALLMIASVVRLDGAAVLEGVFFTAVNQQLLELNDETMPFWQDGVLYVSEKVFEDGELGLRYVHSYSKATVMMYTTKKDLRFDLANSQIYDKQGTVYTGSAVEKNGHVFFPLDLVCRHFDLSWSLSATAYVPLIRVKSEDVVLSDQVFIDAASLMMANRYADYEKRVNSSQSEENDQNDNKTDDPVDDKVDGPTPPPVVDPPLIHARDGQKVHLILAGRSGDSVRAAVDILGENPATFLLTVQQMEDGDLIRALLGRGHSVALIVQSTTADETAEELLRAKELVWAASCSLLQFVWYEGQEDLSALLEQQGCVRVAAQLDRRGELLGSEKAVTALMRLVGGIEEDISLYLGYDSDCAELELLLNELNEAQYHLCAWRLNMR